MKNFLASAWVQHLVFWMLSFYAIGSYFSISNTLKGIDFYYSALFHLPLLYLVYVNVRYLIPRFMREGRYPIYILLTVFNIGAAFFLHEITFEVLLPILPTDYYMVSFTDGRVIVSILVIYWALSSLLKLSKSWYRLQQLERENLMLELNSLKAQINPHFLFNTLNSVYSLARKKSEKTETVILHLSNLLRYMLYDVSEERVALTEEVEAMRYYLDLQALRVEEGVRISLNVDGSIEGVSIAPLLFFPLIENAFKHGLKGGQDHPYLDISLAVSDTAIDFSIRNSAGQAVQTEDKKYGGIGLENVRKRLELIYGKAARMHVEESAQEFTVNIQIQRI